MGDVTVSGHISGFKWTALVLGGVVAGLLMALELFFGVEFVIIWLWQSSPGWIGAFLSLILSVTGPVVAYLVCRSGRRKGQEKSTTWAAAELIGGSVAFASLLIYFVMLLVTWSF